MRASSVRCQVAAGRRQLARNSSFGLSGGCADASTAATNCVSRSVRANRPSPPAVAAAMRARFQRSMPGLTTLVSSSWALTRSRNSGAVRRGSSGASTVSWIDAVMLCQPFQGWRSSFMTNEPLTWLSKGPRPRVSAASAWRELPAHSQVPPRRS
jgi:hypothetical protein